MFFRVFTRTILCLLCLICILVLITGITAAQTSAEIPGRTLATLKLRIAPGAENPVITTLAYRTPVMIEFRNNIGNWLLVRLEDGTRGWAASRFISWSPNIELATIPVSGEVFGEIPAPSATTAPTTSTTAATPTPVAKGEPGRTLARLNVRAAPDITAPLLGRLEYRTQVIIEARNAIGNWLLVTAADGSMRGWVASRFVAWDEEVLLASFPISDEVIGDFDAAAATQAASSAASTVVAPAVVGGRLPDGTVPGRALVQNLNIRRGPGSTFGKLGQIALNTPVIIEARNFIGDWLLIHTQDGALRGWVASRFIGWSTEIPLGSFPISSEEIPG